MTLRPDAAVSPASMAKAYLRAMGVVPPAVKFALPSALLGIAMEAYYGGRAECRIRQTLMPLVYTDFLSQYPTVNTLMGLWWWLVAERWHTDDATEDVRRQLDAVTHDGTFDPTFWKTLNFYALVQPAGDILPVRTLYNDHTTNIGVNPLLSSQPVWYAGPDVVAATLLTGRAPTILKAIRVIPDGVQAGLTPVNLRGMLDVDPRTQDFYKTVIEARAKTKLNRRLTQIERDGLAHFLKILANSGSYGLFVEVNPTPAAAGRRTPLHVFSGESAFHTTSSVVETPGRWYCPVLGSLITAGGRLLLAMLERVVTDAGGSYVFCDTDSMAVVASTQGGLEPCPGGPHRLPDGRDAVKGLSWAEVDDIARRFARLNPYDPELVRSILKIEDVNYDQGSQRALFGYAIASKRYVLFTHTEHERGVRVEKASAHGLGFLYPPQKGFDAAVGAPLWVIEAWEWILRHVLDLPADDPSWFELPAMMRFVITTPQVLKVLQAREADRPYRDRVKPFNFIMSPMLARGGHPVGAGRHPVMLIAPSTDDASRWYDAPFVNIHDGKSYRLAPPSTRLPSEAQPHTYRDIVSRYRRHPEAKSLAPDGTACRADTVGLLQRTPVTADECRRIGKETDRRWEQGEDISLIMPTLVEYRPEETQRLAPDPRLARELRRTSIRAIARASGVSPTTIKVARRGERIRKTTAATLRAALAGLRARRAGPGKRPG